MEREEMFWAVRAGAEPVEEGEECVKSLCLCRTSLELVLQVCMYGYLFSSEITSLPAV